MELLSLVYQTLGILCNNQFLVGRDNQNTNTCVVNGNIHLTAAELVLLRINLDAQIFHVLANVPTNGTIVLTYASGKYDGINAAISAM